MDDEKYSVTELNDDIEEVSNYFVKKEDCSSSKDENLRYNQFKESDVDSNQSWPKCSVIRIVDFTGTYNTGHEICIEHNSNVDNSIDANRTLFRRKRTREDIHPEISKNERYRKRKFRISNRSDVPDLVPSFSCPSIKNYNKLITIAERLELKIGRLQSTLDEIVKKLNHSEPNIHFNLGITQPELPQFPLCTNEEVDDIEEKLTDLEFRNILVSELRKLGGKRVTDLVNKQMSLLMDYSLGCRYSYYGTKEKRPFCVLKLCNVIADVVRLFFPNTTNEELKEPIQTWLRHCKEKWQKKQKLEI